jgi:hypothetical protein
LLFTPTDPRTAKKLLADLDHDERTNRLNVIADKSKSYMSEDLDDNIRKNILLRLWAGCMDAAKNIALETMDGTNCPVTLKEGFFLNLIQYTDQVLKRLLHLKNYNDNIIPLPGYHQAPLLQIIQRNTC